MTSQKIKLGVYGEEGSFSSNVMVEATEAAITAHLQGLGVQQSVIDDFLTQSIIQEAIAAGGYIGLSMATHECVPEPLTVSVLAVGGLMLLRRKRR